MNQKPKVGGRAANTRRKLLDCAIELVARDGYSNTTTQNVLDRSEISRGSLLYQFPTRNDLMVAVGQTALDRMLQSIKTRMDAVGNPLKAIFHYPEILWDTMIEPPALALYEIQMASRWDADLFEGLRAVIGHAETYIEATTRALGRKYGMDDISGFLVDLQVVNDAFPNLAARRALTSNPERITRERERLRDWLWAALNSRLPEAAKKELEDIQI